MEQIINLLKDLRKRLEKDHIFIDNDVFIDTANKIKLYLKKYFADSSDDYIHLLNSVKINPSKF